MFSRSYRNPYYTRRKRRFPRIWQLFFGIIVILILLELLTWAFLSFTGSGKTLNNNYQKPEVVYQLKFLNQNGEPFIGLDSPGQLLVQKTGGQGYELLPQNTSSLWQINEQGFRDQDPLPLEKPPQEKRIFLLGGSTAFGQGTNSNAETITTFLENRLQERLDQQKRSPEKYRPEVLPITAAQREEALSLPPKIQTGQYRVINAGVPGYASGNILAQFALKILPYQPDVVIVLGGYDDLTLPETEEMREIPRLDYLLNHPVRHFWIAITQPIQQFFAKTSIFKTLQLFVFKPEPSLTQKTLAVAPQNQSLVDYLP
ncbi:MAG: SGNH/GDSL hydrolase family protein, partial [Kamptonema sp. SIO4C4]|nr:SGNH/GDSL hydrolase family protein [Kamptonema sp. SIO4C4]